MLNLFKRKYKEDNNIKERIISIPDKKRYISALQRIYYNNQKGNMDLDEMLDIELEMLRRYDIIVDKEQVLKDIDLFVNNNIIIDFSNNESVKQLKKSI